MLGGPGRLPEEGAHAQRTRTSTITTTAAITSSSAATSRSSIEHKSCPSSLSTHVAVWTLDIFLLGSCRRRSSGKRRRRTMRARSGYWVTPPLPLPSTWCFPPYRVLESSSGFGTDGWWPDRTQTPSIPKHSGLGVLMGGDGPKSPQMLVPIHGER